MRKYVMRWLDSPHLDKSGIYQIVNINTGKVYVGSAKKFSQRWKTHEKDLATSQHAAIKLQRSYDKHGKDAFVFQILELAECTRETLLAAEQSWLDAVFPDCYNSNPTAGSALGFRWSEEQRQKARAGASTPERKLIYSQTAKENWADPELAKTMRLAMEKARSVQFQKNFKALDDWMTKNPGKTPSSKSNDIEEKKVSSWSISIRGIAKNNRPNATPLTKEEVLQLNSIGFVWKINETPADVDWDIIKAMLMDPNILHSDIHQHIEKTQKVHCSHSTVMNKRALLGVTLNSESLSLFRGATTAKSFAQSPTRRKNAQEMMKARMSDPVALEIATRKFMELVEKQKVPVVGVNIKTGLLKSWGSSSDAARELGNVTKQANISACLRGLQLTAYGYRWFTKDVYDLRNSKGEV